jgi:hypothetical protein
LTVSRKVMKTGQPIPSPPSRPALLAATGLGALTLLWALQAGPSQASHFFLAPLISASALFALLSGGSQKARATLLAALLLSGIVHLAHFVAQPTSWVGALAAANAGLVLMLSEKHFTRWRRTGRFMPRSNPDRKPPPPGPGRNNGRDLQPTFVLLLAEPRSLHATEWQEIANDAFEPENVHSVKALADGSLEMRGSFGLLRVETRAAPFWPDPREVTLLIADPAIRSAVRSHRAFLLVAWRQPTVSPAGIGNLRTAPLNLIAKLAEADDLAIFHLPSGQINVWSEPVCIRLCNDSSGRFSSERLPPPFRGVPAPATPPAGPCPAVAAFPEFKAAFSRRKAGDQFTVKAAVTEGGQTECVWIWVDALHQETLEGRLANHPRKLPSLRYGSPVAVRIADVQDWSFNCKSG